MRHLLKIHKNNFFRAKLRVGNNWIIPLADNLPGMGKSSFATNYLLKWRQVCDSGLNDEFTEALSRSHKIHVALPIGALTDHYRFESNLLTIIQGELRNLLIPPYPHFLDRTFRTTGEFLSILTSVAGPVFVVLDEIGQAFECQGLNDFQIRDTFLHFVKHVVMTWLLNKDVLVLLVGRARHSLIGQRGLFPIRQMPSLISPCKSLSG